MATLNHADFRMTTTIQVHVPHHLWVPIKYLIEQIDASSNGKGHRTLWLEVLWFSNALTEPIGWTKVSSFRLSRPTTQQARSNGHDDKNINLLPSVWQCALIVTVGLYATLTWARETVDALIPTKKTNTSMVFIFSTCGGCNVGISTVNKMTKLPFWPHSCTYRPEVDDDVN